MTYKKKIKIQSNWAISSLNKTSSISLRASLFDFFDRDFKDGSKLFRNIKWLSSGSDLFSFLLFSRISKVKMSNRLLIDWFAFENDFFLGFSLSNNFISDEDCGIFRTDEIVKKSKLVSLNIGDKTVILH